MACYTIKKGLTFFNNEHVSININEWRETIEKNMYAHLATICQNATAYCFC